MALSQNITNTSIGIPIDNAYAKIILFKCNQDRFTLIVNYFTSREAAEQAKQPVLTRPYSGQFSELQPADNPLQSAYNWLKTQPEFVDAEDV